MKGSIYRKKRDFTRTSEPRWRTGSKTRKASIFVIQKHHARRLHFDLRLEVRGVLKSWAVTREPSSLPSARRLAIETEDHPIAYGSFEGEIPKGQYGAGEVKIWDHGVFEAERSMDDSYDEGKIVVTLKGSRLRGRYALIRVRGEGERSRWLFFKTKPVATGLRIRPAQMPRRTSSAPTSRKKRFSGK